jgi:hypothetical protein
VADVVVREDDFARGDFPAVCAKTGVDCANAVAVRLRIGVRPIRGVLPIVRTRVRVVRVLMAVSYVVLLVAAFLLFSVPALAIAAAALYAVLYLIGDRLWLAAARAGTREELVLRRVHPRFAAAVDEQYGRLSR